MIIFLGLLSRMGRLSLSILFGSYRIVVEVVAPLTASYFRMEFMDFIPDLEGRYCPVWPFLLFKL